MNETLCACYNVSEYIDNTETSFISFMVTSDPTTPSTTEHIAHDINTKTTSSFALTQSNNNAHIYSHLSNPLLFEEARIINVASQFGIQNNGGGVSPAAILFVVGLWLISLLIWCCAPIHDDVPLISKNVIIPSLSNKIQCLCNQLYFALKTDLNVFKCFVFMIHT